MSIDTKDKQIQDLSYENIKCRQHMDRQDEKINRLMQQNQRLVEALDEARKEWRDMFSKSAEVKLALYTLNLCCPDPETMEFETEDGKDDYVDALNCARSFL